MSSLDSPHTKSESDDVRIPISQLLNNVKSKRVNARIQKADLDSDGTISTSELIQLVNDEVRSSSTAKTRLQWLIAVLIVLVISLAANAGLTYAIVDQSKDTEVNNGMLVVKDGSGSSSPQVVKTGRALYDNSAMDLLLNLTPDTAINLRAMSVSDGNGAQSIYDVGHVKIYASGSLVAASSCDGYTVLADKESNSLEVFDTRQEADLVAAAILSGEPLNTTTTTGNRRRLLADSATSWTDTTTASYMRFTLTVLDWGRPEDLYYNTPDEFLWQASTYTMSGTEPMDTISYDPYSALSFTRSVSYDFPLSETDRRRHFQQAADIDGIDYKFGDLDYIVSILASSIRIDFPCAFPKLAFFPSDYYDYCRNYGSYQSHYQVLATADDVTWETILDSFDVDYPAKSYELLYSLDAATNRPYFNGVKYRYVAADQFSEKTSNKKWTKMKIKYYSDEIFMYRLARDYSIGGVITTQVQRRYNMHAEAMFEFIRK